MNRFTTRGAWRALFFFFVAVLLVPNASPLFAQQNDAASTRKAESAAPPAASTRAALGDNSVAVVAAENARIAPLENPQVIAALQKDGVYVEPSMRQMAPPQRLVSALFASVGNRLAVNVLVMPSSWLEKQSADGYAAQLLAFMQRENGLAIVVAGREIGFAGEEIDDATRADILKGAARTFDSESYAAGIAQIAADIAARRAARNALQFQLLGVAGVLLLGGAYWLFRVRRRKARRATNAAHDGVKKLAKNLGPRCKTLGADLDYALLGEDDETRLALLQTHQMRVVEAMARSRRRIESAQTLSDWNVAQAELENVTREYSQARNILRSLPPDFQADENAPHVVEVPPLGSDLAGARVGFALDFFTSQPVARRKMVPVDLTVGNAQRRVWAARETAARVLAGDAQVAVMNYGSAQRAWFDVPHFDAWKNENDALETLPLSEIAAGNARFGSGYIGFGRHDGGWFAPNYLGWNGAARPIREYSQTLENVSPDIALRNAVEESPPADGVLNGAAVAGDSAAAHRASEEKRVVEKSAPEHNAATESVLRDGGASQRAIEANCIEENGAPRESREPAGALDAT